jgi:hypothetical protein
MHRRQAFRTVLLLAALSACVGQGSRPTSGAAPTEGGGEHENLQVLPNDIPHD